MTVLVSYTHLSKDSNNMEVLRIELFDNRSARLLQYGASGTPYYTSTLANTNPNIPGLFEKLVHEKTSAKPVESEARWPSLISFTVFGNNTPPESMSWISEGARSCVPQGLTGYEELQDFFNKLPMLKPSEIRFVLNTSDQFHSGGPPVKQGEPKPEIPKRPTLKPKPAEFSPKSNMTIDDDF